MSRKTGKGKGAEKNDGSKKGWPTHHGAGDDCGCCDVDIHITDPGEVNIYNCSAPGTGGSQCDGDGDGGGDGGGRCPWPEGTCIPVAAGAKHKLSREQKLSRLAEGTPVPSAIA